MGAIAEKKKHLIVPADGRPTGWARGWKFPALPWPPGWPRSERLPANLDVNLYPLVTHGNRVMLDAMARDEFKDLTDELDLEFVHLHAHANGQVIRLRLAEDDESDVWSSSSIGPTGPTGTNWGPNFAAYIDTAQSCNSGEHTVLSFDTEYFDSDSDYDTGTYKFTPSVAGKYLVTVTVGITLLGDGKFMIAEILRMLIGILEVQYIQQQLIHIQEQLW